MPLLAGVPPPAAAGHSAASFGLRVILTGGELLDTPYVLDTVAMTWANLTGLGIGDGRLTRSSHASLPMGKRLLLFGGIDPQTEEALDDIIELCTEASTPSTTMAGFDGHGALASLVMQGRTPPARSLHAVAHAGKRVVLVGGKGGRHGLAISEESFAETEQRAKEEGELADEIRGIMKKAQASANKDRKREQAALAAEAEAEAMAVAEAAKAEKDAEMKKRGDEALRKEQEELRRRKLAEDERRKEASLRTGGGFKLPDPPPK